MEIIVYAIYPRTRKKATLNLENVRGSVIMKFRFRRRYFMEMDEKLEEMGPPGDRGSDFRQGDKLNRFIARFIDLLIALILLKLFSPFGFFAGLTYLLISDGFLKGQSIGKHLLGVCVVFRDSGGVNPFRLSILRNLPIVLAYGVYIIPYVGWFFFALYWF